MSTRESMQLWCRHFTGIQNDTCEAGIDYVSVRDDSGPGMYKWPCISSKGCQTSCVSFAHYTEEEIAEREREVLEALTAFDRFMAHKTDVCPHCGKVVNSLRKVGRCVYGSCGCRMWQGSIPEVWK